MRQLGVKPETLEKYGAVSEPTISEILNGARPLYHWYWCCHQRYYYSEAQLQKNQSAQFGLLIQTNIKQLPKTSAIKRPDDQYSDGECGRIEFDSGWVYQTDFWYLRMNSDLKQNLHETSLLNLQAAMANWLLYRVI